MTPPAHTPSLAPSALPDFVDALAPGDVRLLADVDAARLAAHFALDAPDRPVLYLDLAGAEARNIIERAIAQLAHAVAGLWPYLWGGEDFSAQRDDALGRAHLPIRLAALARRVPPLSQAWAAEAVALLLRGALPRPRLCLPAVEWAQLTVAFAPAGLVVATPLITGQAGAGWVQAIEWLARNADVAVLVLAESIPADADRIRFGARQIEDTAPRQEPPPPTVIGHDDAPTVIALPQADGRPHPQSAVELKLYTLIQADADLRPLFAYNKVVPDLPSLQARADLLWGDGRLVVEIDGPEHRTPLKYRADRHRDYALLCAGYRVLRMTNEDIVADAALAVEKIRDVVRLVQGEAR